MKQQRNLEFQDFEDMERRGEFILPYGQRRHEVKKKVIQSLERHQKTLESFLNPQTRRLGHVYAGSGINRILIQNNGEKRMLDWALIRVRSERSPPTEALYHNRVRILELLGCQYSNCEQPFPYRGDPELPFDNPPAGDIPPTDDFQVFKCGRSSGFTQGKMNGLKTVQLARAKNPQGAGSIVTDTYEHQAAGVHSKAFSINGDSGSFVTNKQNEVIGMIISGDQRKNTTTITPMVDLFTDIKILTHAEDVRIVVGRGD
jgi:hypothetical protein